MTNARIELPMRVGRLLPYVIGGGGVGNLKQSLTISAPGGLPIPTRGVIASSTVLALTVGGGTNVLVTAPVSVDADVRYFHLFDQVDQRVGRFGVGLSDRF